MGLPQFRIYYNRLIKSQVQVRCQNFSIERLKQFCTCNSLRNYTGSGGCSVDKTDLSKKLNYKAIFLGSDNFSIPSLIALTQILQPGNVSVVVSNENNLVGKYAKRNSLELFLWKDFKSKEFEKEFLLKTEKGESFDFGVVASFGFLISSSVINRFPLGILNVHASLLPRWRGAAPIAHAIIHGDNKTGVSIMKIAPYRFDIGPVLYQKEIPIHPHIKALELTSILANVGGEAISHVISNLPRFISNPISQDESQAILSPKLTPEMAEVNWKSLSSLSVYNLFRGLNGTFKLKTSFTNRRVDLDDIGLISLLELGESDKISLQSESQSQKTFESATDFEIFYSFPVRETVSELPKESYPGQIVFHKDILCVKCQSKEKESSESFDKNLSWVFVRKVKVGTKWMSAKDFKNGFLSKCKVEERCFYYNPVQNIVEDKSQISNQNKFKNR